MKEAQKQRELAQQHKMQEGHYNMHDRATSMTSIRGTSYPTNGFWITDRHMTNQKQNTPQKSNGGNRASAIGGGQGK